MEQYCIVTDNCYGLNYYKNNNIQYNTCFVGLFLHSPCYIKLLENFNYYMNSELKQIQKSKYFKKKVKYPIATLKDDIEIHFMHYKSFQEACEKWKRRKERMFPIEDCIIKMDDREYYTKEIGQKFLNLKYEHKFLFLSQSNYIKHKNTICTNYTEICPDGKKLDNDYLLF